MLPPKRLNRLLQQATEMQIEKCNFHCVCSNVESYSLLTDHICTRYSLISVLLCSVCVCVCVCSCMCTHVCTVVWKKLCVGE